MYMLHKTFGVPKGGNGPSVGAYGCSEELARFLPGPRIVTTGERYVLIEPEASVGRVREFMGDVQQLVKAYSWLRAMGTEGLREAADLSVRANNYMEKRLLSIPGVTISFPGKRMPRLEMTRYSLAEWATDTGLSTLDASNRITDFGVDAWWSSHEPWIVPEPFRPEAGEMWSKEDTDEWIDVVAHVLDEGRRDPETVRTAPHNQAAAQINGSGFNDPDTWAVTWAAAYIFVVQEMGPGEAVQQVSFIDTPNNESQVNLDFDTEGHLFGIEILVASRAIRDNATAPVLALPAGRTLQLRPG
ncbi:MAG: hypothetical protein B5766_03115 [Candidatus Lumbricidophila eiseniae]|uniref:glycine dehydrogenase (aminomethyl-transferring) n=1 Tax=Candidatus Lumbricidiphila eiseniae TaxID=1969409 RepID=A0A2A6FU02_9MICO|nr:MAG: hypothetical protein B5766_03115 [Candidatus Lumbricidophila eiseniae]